MPKLNLTYTQIRNYFRGKSQDAQELLIEFIQQDLREARQAEAGGAPAGAGKLKSRAGKGPGRPPLTPEEKAARQAAREANKDNAVLGSAPAAPVEGAATGDGSAALAAAAGKPGKKKKAGKKKKGGKQPAAPTNGGAAPEPAPAAGEPVAPSGGASATPPATDEAGAASAGEVAPPVES